jgi:predicted enzyme related to lactoylglutathione lyase
MGAPFVWFDLTEADGAKIAGFYQGLSGWETGPGAGSYQDWLLDGGQPWAGTVPAGAAPAGHWIPYVAVDNLAAAVSKAVDLGGTVIRDKLTGPAGSSVIVADPGGALIALFTPAAG